DKLTRDLQHRLLRSSKPCSKGEPQLCQNHCGPLASFGSMAADQADTIPVRRDTAVLAGNFGVGKTSLFHRLTGTAPGTNRGSAVLRLQNGTRIQLMDTCDMERFENKSLTVSYYRDAACVLLVADASDARSVQSLQNWRDSAGFYAPRAQMILVFNKGDSPDADGILLSSIESYQQRLGCCYSVVTSTKTGQGIDLLRDRIGAACRQFRRNTLQLPDQHRSFQLQREPSRQSSTAAADDSPQKSRCGC
ncbi:hypothetical protein BOX15_Mlig001547g3, partial [Macrostomum lignano]